MDLSRRITKLTEKCQKHFDGFCSTSYNSNDRGQRRERFGHVVARRFSSSQQRAEDSFQRSIQILLLLTPLCTASDPKYMRDEFYGAQDKNY